MEEEEEDTCFLHKFTRREVDGVNIGSWYKNFKEFCPKTVLLPVPPEVLKYLKSDGMVMPRNTHTTAHLNYLKKPGDGSDNEGEEDDNESWASLSDTQEAPSVPPEFFQQLRKQEGSGGGHALEEGGWERKSNSSSDEEDAVKTSKSLEVDKFHEFDSVLSKNINELGGAVVPKINRKSPKDATWIGFNRSLKCYNPGDIYLLLKTSDIISQVLEDPYRDCNQEEDGAASNCATSTSPYLLVLKEWQDSWGPEMEFRCFITDGNLIAICQKDLDTCYSSIVKRKEKLLVNIGNFFIRNIHGKFPLDYYVMDIICHPNGEIYVVDFDVFGLTTDPLLFTYQELSDINKEYSRSIKGSLVSNENSSPMPRRGEPCLRILTESRTFRGRKSASRSALTNDVMTFMRQSVNK